MRGEGGAVCGGDGSEGEGAAVEPEEDCFFVLLLGVGLAAGGVGGLEMWCEDVEEEAVFAFGVGGVGWGWWLFVSRDDMAGVSKETYTAEYKPPAAPSH